MFSLKKNRFFFSNIVLDEEGETETTAKIYFKTGDKYEGYVFMNNPNGKGKLRLKDKSYYQGDFTEWGLQKGKFVHSSKMHFEGEFYLDNFKQGIFTFSNGDFFEGVWNQHEAIWVLQSGSFYHRTGVLMQKFDGQPLVMKDIETKRIRIVYPSTNLFFNGAGFYEGEFKDNDTPAGTGIFIGAQPFWKELNFQDGLKQGLQRYTFNTKRSELYG